MTINELIENSFFILLLLLGIGGIFYLPETRAKPHEKIEKK